MFLYLNIELFKHKYHTFFCLEDKKFKEKKKKVLKKAIFTY